MSTEALAVIGAATGVVGALTGLASLVWQVIVHRRSGRLVTVVTSYSIPVWGPPHAPEFRNDDQVSIEVINRGGAPVVVTNYGISLDGKRRKRNLFATQRSPMSATLPARVEPGGQPAAFYIPVNDLRRIHADEGVAFKRMRPWADLGDGRRVFASKSVRLA